MSTPSLSQLVVRHQVLLERLKSGNVREFNRIIPELSSLLDQFIMRLQGDIGTLPRGTVNALLTSLKREQNALLAHHQEALISQMKALAKYEANFEVTSLGTVVHSSAVIVAPQAVAAWTLATTTPLSATGDLLEPWVREMTAAEMSAVNKLIMRGYAEGWTNQQLTQGLKGTRAARFTDGLLTKMGRHNSTIVRTAIQHVSSTAREAVWQANRDVIEKYRWVSVLDSRTSEQCASLDGMEFELDNGPRPPIHPNCRSTTIAVLKGPLAILAEGRTRASADGPVASDMTYYEWLQTQPADFQRGVLGPTRYELFTSDGMTADKFAKMQLSSTFQPLTLEQMGVIERKR